MKDCLPCPMMLPPIPDGKSKAEDAVKIAAAAEAALAAAVAAKAELEVEVLRYQAIAKKAGTRIQAVTYLFICDGFGGSIDVFS